jgi:hypothetical protein
LQSKPLISSHFTTQVNRTIGPPVELEDLVPIHVDVPTPEHELYEDDDGSVPVIVLDIDQVTP